jgi:hypothetical protein
VSARTVLRFAAFALVLSVAACGWPSEGAGGLAERGQPATPAIEEAAETLERLASRGADRFAAGDLAEARLILARASREQAGGLTVAAEQNMVRLKASFERIERRLNAAPPTPLGQ